MSNGEIEISFSYQEHFIDVYLTNQDTIRYTYELGIGENIKRLIILKICLLRKYKVG